MKFLCTGRNEISMACLPIMLYCVWKIKANSESPVILKRISFTCIALKPHNYFEKTDEAAACGFTVDLHLLISY